MGDLILGLEWMLFLNQRRTIPCYSADIHARPQELGYLFEALISSIVEGFWNPIERTTELAWKQIVG
jgi:hypothetical protein